MPFAVLLIIRRSIDTVLGSSVSSSTCNQHTSSISHFFFNDTATTEIYTLSLHDALPICPRSRGRQHRLQGPHGQRHSHRLARGRRPLAGGAAARHAGAPRPDRRRRGARGRHAVLHQLHHRVARLLDHAGHGDHGAPRGRVPLSGRPHRATRAPPPRRGERRRRVVVPFDARVSRRPAHRQRSWRRRRAARVWNPARVARFLGGGVPRGVDTWLAALRGGGRMRQVLRLFAAFWRINVAEELQYRANFVASVLGTLFYMATALLTLALFFRHTSQLGGWDYWEIVVLLGVFNTLTGVIEAVLRPGIGSLVGEVRSGELDLVLVKPVDPQGFVSFRRLDIWRFTDIVLGLALAGYALHRMGRAPSWEQLVAFGLALAAAAVVVYAIWVLLMSLAFWFVSVENIAVLFDALFEGARYPVSAYPGALRFLFVYLIPIAWTTTVPASALTGRLRPALALVAALVAALVFLLARLAWRVALRRYAGASG